MSPLAAAGGPLLVALYGPSLMVAGLAHRLERQSELNVVEINGPTVSEALGRLQPAALVIDLAAVPFDAAVALLSDRPELFLVGLDASGARLLVLSGDQARAVSTRDLVALIERRRGTHQRTSH